MKQPKLELKDAKLTECCRICGQPIFTEKLVAPRGWQDLFGEMTFPDQIVLNFGEEFAHKTCLDLLPK